MSSVERSGLVAVCALVLLYILSGLLHWQSAQGIIHGTQTLAAVNQLGSLQSNSVHMCGAFRINHTHALTAAHCMLDMSDDTKRLIFSVNTLAEMWKSVAYNITEVVRWNYTDSNPVQDLALLNIRQVSQDLMGHHTPPEEYPIDLMRSTDVISTTTQCYIMGWGMEGYNFHSYTKSFQIGMVSLVDKVRCNQATPGEQKDNVALSAAINDKCTLCAMGRSNTCKGDSGGPLICQTTRSLLKLVGITSYGVDCVSETVPGIYTDVRCFV